jgi:hypothetical protein
VAENGPRRNDWIQFEMTESIFGQIEMTEFLRNGQNFFLARVSKKLGAGSDSPGLKLAF